MADQHSIGTQGQAIYRSITKRIAMDVGERETNFFVQIRWMVDQDEDLFLQFSFKTSLISLMASSQLSPIPHLPPVVPSSVPSEASSFHLQTSDILRTSLLKISVGNVDNKLGKWSFSIPCLPDILLVQFGGKRRFKPGFPIKLRLCRKKWEKKEIWTTSRF